MNKSKYKDLINQNSDYIFPDLENKIKCPLCQKSFLNIHRTIHKLPDNEEILILLMECPTCAYKNRDIIPLVTAFKPAKWTLYIEDGDLTPKIFRGPEAYISIPELDIKLEPGTIANYLITNVEGLLDRMLNWSKFLLLEFQSKDLNKEKKSAELIKVENTIKMLNECITGKRKFHIILEDKFGGSYISIPSNKKKNLKFEEYNEK
ncbi:MAG: ZPR1 zinc finger domain-containing protein [Promethearchaeota archaeon]